MILQAIRIANGSSYVLYDSRATVHGKQNRLEDALPTSRLPSGTATFTLLAYLPLSTNPPRHCACIDWPSAASVTTQSTKDAGAN